MKLMFDWKEMSIVISIFLRLILSSNLMPQIKTSLSNQYLNSISILVFVVCINAGLYSLANYHTIIDFVRIESGLFAFLGAVIAGFPVAELFGYSTTGVERVSRINNAIEKLLDSFSDSDGFPTIDENVDGFDEIATKMLSDNVITTYPKTISKPPVPETLIINGDNPVRFSTRRMTHHALSIEREEQGRYQRLGLKVVALGFALQLLSEILPN